MWSIRPKAFTTLAILFLRCHSAVAATAPPIYVINLDRDTERLTAVTAELRSQGLKMHRLPAVHGKTLKREERNANTTRLARIFCTPGMIGCYLSHVNFWRKTLESTSSWSIVFEDDVILADKFSAQLNEAIGELESNIETQGGNWDVLMLGALGSVHPNKKYGLNRIVSAVAGNQRKPRWISTHVHVPRRAMGTHAYVLSKRGAAKLLARAALAASHVDAVIWGIKDLDLYAVHPMIAHQDMRGCSTVGAVLDGVEASLPDLIVDDYTGVTLRWAFNEPVIRIPVLGITMTTGRSIIGIVSGFIISGIFGSMKLLTFHVFLCSSGLALVSAMVKPSSGRR